MSGCVIGPKERQFLSDLLRWVKHHVSDARHSGMDVTTPAALRLMGEMFEKRGDQDVVLPQSER